MTQFLNFVRTRHFQRPKLIINSAHRAASPLELFIDLAYVGMLSAIVHYLVGAEHIGAQEVLGFVLRFMSMFALWYNMVWYNNLFEDQTWRHRFLMLMVVFTVLIQQVSMDANNEQALYFLSGGYVISRLLQAFIWWRAVDQTDIKASIKRSTAPYVIGSLVAALLAGVGTVLFAYDTTIVLSVWTLTVLAEFFIPNLMFNRTLKIELQHGNTDVLPPVSHHLFMERFALIFILILGEGALASAKILGDHSQHFWPAIGMSALVLLIALLMWQLYFGIVQLMSYHEDKILLWSWLNLPIFMGALLTLGLSVELYHPHHPETLPMLYNLYCIAVGTFIVGVSLSHLFRKDEAARVLALGYRLPDIQKGRRILLLMGLTFFIWLWIRVPPHTLLILTAVWMLAIVLRNEYTRYRASIHPHPAPKHATSDVTTH